MEGLQVLQQTNLLGKELKVYGTVENPLFLAKDVAEWIGHSNHRSMILSVDEEEKNKSQYPHKLCLRPSIRRNMVPDRRWNL